MYNICPFSYIMCEIKIRKDENQAMGFNIYFAGSYQSSVDGKIMELGGNRLFSQLNDRNGLKRWIPFKEGGATNNLFIDSGAFSAHTKDSEVEVDDYISYVNEHPGVFSVIAQVDTIPGKFRKPKTRQQILEAPEKSWENYLYMRERVHDVPCLTPIFHQGEDFKHLKRMLETTFHGEHIEYIGISPANDVQTKDKKKWFEQVYQIIRDSSNPHVKTHAYGMTSFKVLEQYPVYSADSTSWLMNASMGAIMTPFGTIFTSEVKAGNSGHWKSLSANDQQWLIDHVDKFGMTMEQLESDYKARELFNVMYVLEWAKNYEFKGTGRYQRRLF